MQIVYHEAVIYMFAYTIFAKSGIRDILFISGVEQK